MRKDVVGVAALVTAAVALRVPSFWSPLSDDEGGFLLVASQWGPGTSLYGDYWVDRPPLLVAAFEVAHRLGGPTALRVTGCVAVAVAVLAAARLGRLVAPSTPHAPLLTAAVAAVFLSTPLFSAGLVKGELLAVPLVLVGLLALLAGMQASDATVAARWWLAAGSAAALAAGMKQSIVDVFLAAGVATVVVARTGRWRRAALLLGCVTGAGVAVTAASVVWAAGRGTDPVALWDAVVTFRAEASGVIVDGAPADYEGRAARLALAFAGSGAAGLLVALLPARGRRPAEAGDGPAGLPAVTAAVVVWELVAVVAGGSYWLHYLVGTVPGLVLVAAAAARQRARLRVVTTVTAYGAAATLVANVAVTAPPGPPSPAPADEVAVASYLREAARPGDTGVTAFGSPWILHESGLESPYPLLWSLPVRVHDPLLARFERLLRSAGRPTWVAVEGASVTTWGVDGAAADRVLERRYRLVREVGDWRILRARGFGATGSGK